MSSRRISNQQLREAALQRFVSEIERKYNEITSDERGKKQDMKLFRELINPENNETLKYEYLSKLKRRIIREISVLFKINDLSMLDAIAKYTFSTRHRLLDDPRFLPRQTIRESILSTDRQQIPTRQTRPRSSSIRGPRRQEEITLTPGVWNRESQFPTYTTNPGSISSITQTPSAPVRSLMPQTPLAPITSQIPETPSQQTQNVPWGYEDTSTILSSISEFEEDQLPNTKIRSDKNSLIINGADKLSTCNNEDNDPDPNETILSEDNKRWVEANCHNCQDIATQYNYTQEQSSDLVSIKQLDSNGKFKLSQCTSIKYFKESLKRDLITSSEKFNIMDYQTIFSIYELKNKNLSKGDLKRGLGTRPTKMLLFLLKLPSVSIYIDLESAYKLVHNKTKELYALPLFGGLRRRVGNLKGSLMESSTVHGQLDGYKIYRLLTRSEIENEMEIDFELQLLTELQSLLHYAYKEDETDKKRILNVTNNIINILTNEQNTY